MRVSLYVIITSPQFFPHYKIVIMVSQILYLVSLFLFFDRDCSILVLSTSLFVSKMELKLLLFMCRLTPVGDPPSPRAAHAATAVGTMVVIQVHVIVCCRGSLTLNEVTLVWVIFLLVCRNSRCVRKNMIGTAASGFSFGTFFNSFQRRNCLPCFGIYSSCYSRKVQDFFYS